MRRKRLSSTSIASVGYDRTSATLEIEFIGGTIYQYFDVPEADYKALMSAPSKGTYVNRYLKKAGYEYTRVR